jgi:hypothetical protein
VNPYVVTLIVGAVAGYLYGWRRGLAAGAYESWQRFRGDA